MELAIGSRNLDLARRVYRSSKMPVALASNVLKQDLRVSTQFLRGMRNQYVGKRCFVIGNGPSLNEMDLSPLYSEYTFGLNRIYLAFTRIKFHTTFLVVANSLVIEQIAGDLPSIPSMKFINWSAHSHVPPSSNTYFFQADRTGGFSRRPDLFGFRTSATVTSVAIQLAYFLGFTEVVLIGVDHSFVTRGTAHKEVVSDGPDPNHFDPNYFGKGFRWQLPDLEESEKGYRELKRLFEADRRRIVDATVGGKLDVFPKVAYADLFP